jgi:hypothetical protein
MTAMEFMNLIGSTMKDEKKLDELLEKHPPFIVLEDMTFKNLVPEEKQERRKAYVIVARADMSDLENAEPIDSGFLTDPDPADDDTGGAIEQSLILEKAYTLGIRHGMHLVQWLLLGLIKRKQISKTEDWIPGGVQ